VIAQRKPSCLLDRSGAAGVQFALIGPVFLALVTGMLGASVTAYSPSGLQTAVEQAARCSSLNKTTCSNSDATVAFARSHYFGLDTPTFAVSAAACGHVVSASLNLTFEGLLVNNPVPLSATSCFP
jgi:Flp pilus assembly protein TadG